MSLEFGVWSLEFESLMSFVLWCCGVLCCVVLVFGVWGVWSLEFGVEMSLEFGDESLEFGVL